MPPRDPIQKFNCPLEAQNMFVQIKKRLKFKFFMCIEVSNSPTRLSTVCHLFYSPLSVKIEIKLRMK